ncbi:MAG: UMP kinase [Candidatus Lokiarchaeota archaeon]|nr:UMP kinase [Candidatus Lokiarchaeota archaeon]
MGYIIKFGGSIFFHQHSTELKVELIQELANIVLSHKEIIGLVCGGGKVARYYIHAGRKLGFKESTLDHLGIMVSRINAQVLITVLNKNTYPDPISNINQARLARSRNQLFVAGGFIPKQSTTTVAMQLCEVLDCNLIVLTDVDGIYNKDPKTYPEAKKYDKIKVTEIQTLLTSRSNQEKIAGKYQIFDLLSWEILKRSKIQVRFINGIDLNNLKLLLSEDFEKSKIGTLVSHEIE